MQNKEDIILSRMQQLDPSFFRNCFILHGGENNNSIKSNQAAARYLAQYILFFLDLASKEIAISYNDNHVPNCEAQTIIPLLENFFVLLWYIAKSGMYLICLL